MANEDEEGEFKPEARCRYHSVCKLYNNDVLPLNTELIMCGRGHEIDKDYLPQIPEVADFQPVQDYPADPAGNCDAYMRYIESGLIRQVRESLEGMRELLKEHGYD